MHILRINDDFWDRVPGLGSELIDTGLTLQLIGAVINASKSCCIQYALCLHPVIVSADNAYLLMPMLFAVFFIGTFVLLTPKANFVKKYLGFGCRIYSACHSVSERNLGQLLTGIRT